MTNDTRFKIGNIVYCFDLNLMPVKAKVTVVHVWKADGRLIKVVYELETTPSKADTAVSCLTKDERQVFETVEEMKKYAYEEALLSAAMNGTGKTLCFPGIYSGAITKP